MHVCWLNFFDLGGDSNSLISLRFLLKNQKTLFLVTLIIFLLESNSNKTNRTDCKHFNQQKHKRRELKSVPALKHHIRSDHKLLPCNILHRQVVEKSNKTHNQTDQEAWKPLHNQVLKYLEILTTPPILHEELIIKSPETKKPTYTFNKPHIDKRFKNPENKNPRRKLIKRKPTKLNPHQTQK